MKTYTTPVLWDRDVALRDSDGRPWLCVTDLKEFIQVPPAKRY
jgi:hypothetical protein